MAHRVLMLVAVSIGGVLFLAEDAAAQGGGRYRSPYGPTISPYLDYFRRDNGVLNPYYNFVRPKLQAQDEFRQMENQLQQQGNDQRRLAKDLQDTKESTAAATGSAATFMNYLHYYPRAGAGGGRR